MEKVSAVKSSLSVPPTEQAKWDSCKESLMTTIHELGGKMSFSNFVRLVVYGHNIEKRPDGLYLTVKLD